LPGAPSDGIVLNFRAWYDAWVTVVGAVVGEVAFVFWPFGIGEP
jgi:hypothetical protein